MSPEVLVMWLIIIGTVHVVMGTLVVIGLGAACWYVGREWWRHRGG